MKRHLSATPYHSVPLAASLTLHLPRQAGVSDQAFVRNSESTRCPLSFNIQHLCIRCYKLSKFVTSYI